MLTDTGRDSKEIPAAQSVPMECHLDRPRGRVYVRPHSYRRRLKLNEFTVGGSSCPADLHRYLVRVRSDHDPKRQTHFWAVIIASHSNQQSG